MLFYELFPKKLKFILPFMMGIACESTPSNSASDLKVLVTIKPIHSLVANVMGDLGDPKLLITGKTSPHTYALKASDAKALNSAEIIFRVSDEIEPFLKKTLESLPLSTKIITLMKTPGLTLLKTRGSLPVETEQDKVLNRNTYYQKSQSSMDSSDDGLNFLDGHIWLDPQNAIILLKEINRNLKELLPSDASILDKNTTKAILEIDKMSAQIMQVLKPLRGKPYLVSHDALQYYENYFHLPSRASITFSPDVQPSGKHIAQIRSLITRFKDLCLFTEPDTNSRILDTVLEGNKVKVGQLDPEGLLVSPGRSAYFDTLKNITHELQSCLE